MQVSGISRKACSALCLPNSPQGLKLLAHSALSLRTLHLHPTDTVFVNYGLSVAYISLIYQNLCLLLIESDNHAHDLTFSFLLQVADLTLSRNCHGTLAALSRQNK